MGANILGTLKNDLNRASNQLNGVRQLHELITKILNQDKPEIEKSQELRRQMEEAKTNLHDALLDAEGAQKRIEPLAKYADRRLFATLGKLLQDRKDSDEGDASREISIVGDQIKNAEERALIQAKAEKVAAEKDAAAKATEALKVANDEKSKKLEEEVKKAEDMKKKDEEQMKKAADEEKVAKLATEKSSKDVSDKGKLQKLADNLKKAEDETPPDPKPSNGLKADGKAPGDPSVEDKSKKLDSMIKAMKEKVSDASTAEPANAGNTGKVALANALQKVDEEKKEANSREDEGDLSSTLDASRSDEDATESLKSALSQAKLVSEAIRQAAAQNKNDEQMIDLSGE